VGYLEPISPTGLEEGETFRRKIKTGEILRVMTLEACSTSM
jgi:hypothetical protein